MEITTKDIDKTLEELSKKVDRINKRFLYNKNLKKCITRQKKSQKKYYNTNGKTQQGFNYIYYNF